jgi:hypothetical protein
MPGIEKLVAMWREDEAMADASNRPVNSPKCQLPADRSGQTVYISSKVFGKTFPFDVDFEVPTAVVTDRIVNYLDAPRQQDYKGMLGCRYDYSLSDGHKTLVPIQSLKAQGVAEKSLLWLQIESTPFAVGESVDHEPIRATFRGSPSEAIHAANAALLEWSQKLGLGY